MGQVLTVNVVYEVRPDRHNDAGRSGIDKRPVGGRVAVGALGLAGDQQLDVKHHGGRDKAVYAYASEDADWWSRELGRPIAPGQFGENLTTRGIDLTGAFVGECWQVGDAVLEVAQPRMPCATFQDWMGERGWVKRFTQHGAPGVYLRVLGEGSVGAGDPIQVLDRPAHGVSIGACFGDFEPATAQRLLSAASVGEVDLASSLRRYAERALART